MLLSKGALLLLLPCAFRAQSDWALLSVTNFHIESAHDPDSHPDVYATVRVEDVHSSYTHQTKLSTDQKTGSLDWHIYIPAYTNAIKATLWDRDPAVLDLDDQIGGVVVKLGRHSDSVSFQTSGIAGSSTNSTFQLNKKGSLRNNFQSADNVGTLRLALTNGDDALREAAKGLMMRGRQPVFGDPGHNFLTPIPADSIEDEVGFARTGSAFPGLMQGIWWMDQRCMYRSASMNDTDPTYQCTQHLCAAANELAVAFGESEWDPVSRCARHIALWNGPPTHGGHWVWMDEGNVSNFLAGLTKSVGQSFEFCFHDNDTIRAKVSIDLGLGDTEVPGWLTGEYWMIRKPWGMDRMTHKGGETCHYPVYQVVDGDGKRTEHYDAYLNWANNQSDCGESSFHCHMNNGRGKVLVSRLHKRNETTGDFMTIGRGSRSLVSMLVTTICMVSVLLLRS